MRHWLAYAKTRQELDIADAIREKGADAWVARKVELYRAPTKRRWEPKTEPFLPNYILVTCSDETWHALRDIKGLAHTMMAIAPTVFRKDFTPFIDRVDADYRYRLARIEAGERVEAYDINTVLQVTAGPLKGHLGFFKRMVEDGEFVRIRMGVDFFGAEREIDVDPIHVRHIANA